MAFEYFMGYVGHALMSQVGGKQGKTRLSVGSCRVKGWWRCGLVMFRYMRHITHRITRLMIESIEYIFVYGFRLGWLSVVLWILTHARKEEKK